jgi:bla regulator protein blaR1
MTYHAAITLLVTAWLVVPGRTSIAQDAARQQSSTTVGFEVASVRPNKSGPGSTFMRRLPGVGFEAGNVTPRDLILFAYDIQRPYLIGLPGWADNERFDIVARAGAVPQASPAGSSVDWTMVRKLLEDRFRLAVRTETREMQVYALVLARSDGRLGPQLRRSQVDCTPRSPAPPSADGAGQPQCANRNGPGFTAAVGRPISSFLFFLTGQVQRAVIDRTGLTGAWDIELTFSPDGFADPATPQNSGPSLFTALQEQLGLRLEPSTGPVQVLVVDRIERPTEN